jgi:soluble lytic murein transglycosylase-like protein
LVTQAAQRYGIPVNVALAQINQESGYNVNAHSYAGAMGLAQFMPATARRFGLSNPYDPVASLEAWGKYMSLLMSQFRGRVDLALAGYNSGENRQEYKNAAAQGRAINWSVLPAGVQSQTRDYVTKIMRAAGASVPASTPVPSLQPTQQPLPVPSGGDDSASDTWTGAAPPTGSTGGEGLVLVAAALVAAWALFFRR